MLYYLLQSLHIVNRSTGRTPFEIVHGFKPTPPINLVPISPLHRGDESVEVFAQHMHDLHKHISDQINPSNLKYKILADFKIGD